MADGADVRSIDAVRDWHAALATYGEGLAEALAGVELEIRRAHEWLQEQLALWKRAIRDCEEEVTRAKAELAQRKFPGWDGREEQRVGGFYRGDHAFSRGAFGENEKRPRSVAGAEFI